MLSQFEPSTAIGDEKTKEQGEAALVFLAPRYELACALVPPGNGHGGVPPSSRSATWDEGLQAYPEELSNTPLHFPPSMKSRLLPMAADAR